ncbi:hypothetical protein FRB90_000552 [Tulasnella sp. 427]|nr:hypothetical protein FRB90_000552 [Tulasnella sp. 427]
MTASVPSGAMKHAKRNDAKQLIVGQAPVDPPELIGTGLGKTATRSKAGCAKRPEALRNPDVVKEIQRRIKVHLASNNMIKGSARASAAATPGQQILFFHNTPNHPQFTQSPSHIVHRPFSSTPPHPWPTSSSSDHSSGPLDTSPLPAIHSLVTTAPQPSSTPSDDMQGGAAGGVGASYDGNTFLSFADLIGAGASSHIEAPARKGKTRQPKPTQATQSWDGEDPDGSGEEDYEIQQGDQGSDEGGSSFSRHPPGYPPPNYNQFRGRYGYDEMGSPPQPAPYHSHAPRPFAQSDMRTTRGSDYENDAEMRIENGLRRAEGERESYHRRHMPEGSLHHSSHDMNMGHPAFPSHHFVYGPGVGTASAGRALNGYTQYGHAGYRGPSPSNSLNSSFPAGPPPPRIDPLYSGPRLSMMDPRHSAASLPGPPLSLSMSRNGGGSPTSDQYLQPMEHTTNGNGYSDSGYRSPNPTPGRSPMGAGMSSSHDGVGNGPAELVDEPADLDGDPIPQMSATLTATPVNDPIQISADFITNPHLPNESSFGPIYSFDRTFQEVDADATANSIGALISAASNPAVNNTLPLSREDFNSIMALLEVGSLADAPAVIAANAQSTDYTEIAALQQLQVGIAPPPPIDSQPMYVATFGNQHLQFTTRQMELLHLYKNDLCNLQYHIAHSTDSSIADELFDLAMHSEAALFGTLTLTSLYKIRLRGSTRPQPEEVHEVSGFKDRVSTALERKKQLSLLDSGDAMAALHMVSAVLFEGGTRAEWDQFLDIAKAYVAQHPVVTLKSWHSSPTMDGSSSSTALVGRASNVVTTTVDKKTQFIIKTVAWFDVIGSVTMRRQPYFLDTYRELFGRQGGNAMERIMGCNEKVLLAIAETAALAAWKRKEETLGTLNNLVLSRQANKIEELLKFVGPQYNGARYDESQQERQAHTVRLVSNVFRAAGRLYLYTVASGCNPNIIDIKEAVQATVDAFKALQASDFDRSLVFPITLAGCMTDDKDHRSYLERRLLQLGFKGQAVGNSSSCLKLMHEVWKRRDTKFTGSRVVDWIDTMNELEWCLLLV